MQGQKDLKFDFSIFDKKINVVEAGKIDLFYSEEDCSNCIDFCC